MKYSLKTYLVAFMMVVILHEKAFYYPPLCNMDFSGDNIKGNLWFYSNWHKLGDA
jgi:hypothetical protein